MNETLPKQVQLVHLLLRFLIAFLCVQSQTATCVTPCAQTPAVGARGLTSASPVGTTVAMAHVLTAVISTLGQYVCMDLKHLMCVLVFFSFRDIHTLFLDSQGNLQDLMANALPATQSVSRRLGESAVLDR